MTGIIGGFIGSGEGQKIVFTEKLKVTSTTAGTTLATAANALVTTSGRIYIVMLAWDPSGSSVPTVTLSDTANTYTALSTLYPAPATTTAGSGVIIQSFITTAAATANRTLTATFSASITAKTMTIIELQGATTTQRSTATTSRGTTAAPSYTTGAGTKFDLVLATLGQETNNAGAPTAAGTNTTGGPWQGLSNNFTTGGAAATNIGISYQYKLLSSDIASTTVGWTMGATTNWGSQTFILQAA